MTEYFAVIDTETTWNEELMTVGVVISNIDNFEIVDKLYIMLNPAFLDGGMYEDRLFIEKPELFEYKPAINKINELLNKYHITKVFAYNALFDYNLLKDLSSYDWYDIMKIAAYKTYNKKIPDYIDCYKTGKMKKGYGVEPMLRLIKDENYFETHNAVIDASDELSIMKLLELPFETFLLAKIN